MRLSTKLLIMTALLAIITLPATAQKNKTSYNFNRAMEEAVNGNTQSALEYFEKEVAENPKNGKAYLGMAIIHTANLQYGEALNAVESALKYIPKNNKEKLSDAYELRGIIHAIVGDTIKAYSDYTLAIKQNPNNVEAFDERGKLYFQQGRYDESEKDYIMLTEISPGDAEGYLGLGRIANERKEYDKAIEFYDRAISLHPDNSSGYFSRAYIHIVKNNYTNAMDDICKALELENDYLAYNLLYLIPKDQLPLCVAKLKAMSIRHPNTGEYEYYIAMLYNRNHMYAESNDALERALNIDTRSDLLERMAENYSEMGDYVNALACVERASQMNPDDDDLLVKRADILGESGNIEGAIATWGEFIEKNPDFYGGYYRRGFFEDNSGRTDDALADYNMSIMLEPDYAYAYLGKGDMLERLGRHEEALDAYRKVVELDTIPNNTSCAMYALLALDHKEEAVDFINKVIENDSIDPGTYYDAACFTCRLGDNQKALNYLRTAFKKGFRRFWQVRNDDDLIPLHSLPEFETIISEFETQGPVVMPSIDTVKNVMPTSVEIPFTPTGGVAQVRCLINDLPLNFIFDTGASTVSLSMVEANFMLKNGYLKDSDMVGTGRFRDADGDISEGTVINLRQIDFGGLKLNNVRASVVRNQKAPLLLGQSVLGRLGAIEIDNQNKKIIIKSRR